MENNYNTPDPGTLTTIPPFTPSIEISSPTPTNPEEIADTIPTITQTLTPSPTEGLLATESVAATPATSTIPDEKPHATMNGMIFPILFAIIAAGILFITILTLIRKNKKIKSVLHKPRPINQERKVSAWAPISAGGCQYIGTREHQEDAFGISDVHDQQLSSQKGVLAVVADGIGGMDDGQIASKLVVQTIANQFYQETEQSSPALRLLTLVANAHLKLNEYRQQHGTRCGSTLVAALLECNDLYFISVGDSRIMLYRQGGLIQLNREHNLGRTLEERTVLKDSDVSVANRKPAALTSHMGMDDLRLIDRNTTPIHLLNGDKILLMSDGVYNTLSEAELLSLLGNTAGESATHICEAVKAKQRRSQDNATAVVLNIG